MLARNSNLACLFVQAGGGKINWVSPEGKVAYNPLVYNGYLLCQ